MKLFSNRELALQLCFLSAFTIGRSAVALAFTGSLNGLAAGAPFEVTWTGTVGTSSLTLLSATIVVNYIACTLSTSRNLSKS